MAIFLLPYIATFSGQLYFRRNYFLTLLKIDYYDTIVIFFGANSSSRQLLLQGAPFPEE